MEAEASVFFELGLGGRSTKWPPALILIFGEAGIDPNGVVSKLIRTSITN
jgi:hypothetical protein